MTRRDVTLVADELVRRIIEATRTEGLGTMNDPIWYIAWCQDCTPDMPQPFTSEAERDAWADAHRSGAGHTVTTSEETKARKIGDDFDEALAWIKENPNRSIDDEPIKRLEVEVVSLLRTIMMILLTVGGRVEVPKRVQDDIRKADRRIRQQVDPVDGTLIIELGTNEGP